MNNLFRLPNLICIIIVPFIFPGELKSAAPQKPNIIFIMADDLGYGDLGCYGQKLIKTPHIDKLAKEGMLFTQFYAGSTVCAPSRSVLMTGQHLGHTRVRGNTSVWEHQSLRPEDVTVAELLKQAGYKTGMFGKWGVGEEGTTGVPNKQGWDEFFGYLNQGHAHNYYPEFLWHNDKKVKLRNVVEPKNRRGKLGGYATTRIDYSHDLIMERAMKFLDANHKSPFFLYLPVTIPHANNEGNRICGDGQEVPDYGIYKDKDWPKQDKGQAAMISRLDSDVGRMMDKLKQFGIDEKTVVMFTSDNGHHNEGGHNTERFDPNGPLRGMKRDLYEGGIRVPMIVRWPGVVKAGSISDHIGYFGDFMATAAELSGQNIPANCDSISFLPTLTGQQKKQLQHRYLYWEFYEQGGKQAVRMGRWKAVRIPAFTGPIQLFDMETDLGEGTDVAQQNPDIVGKIKTSFRR